MIRVVRIAVSYSAGNIRIAGILRRGWRRLRRPRHWRRERIPRIGRRSGRWRGRNRWPRPGTRWRGRRKGPRRTDRRRAAPARWFFLLPVVDDDIEGIGQPLNVRRGDLENAQRIIRVRYRERVEIWILVVRHNVKRYENAGLKYQVQNYGELRTCQKTEIIPGVLFPFLVIDNARFRRPKGSSR